MSTVIKVENLSKQYQLGQVGTGTMANDVNRWWHRVRGKEDPYLKIGEENDRTKKGSSEFVWALKDINFEVKDGEVLGIIGRNGAGKSTLLKILSRTTAPTTGQIKIKGRVASLLEVGTGFHPELSGRDNIFLNGAILGMTKAEIKRKFDEIVDFAGVERYIDTPVKRYSSGMYVRLAFGVAAHLEPEILIVDEVLAVGDVEFQKKCLGKMKDVSVNGGRTVLFVSHNMAAMKTLCDKGILMNNGLIEFAGPTNESISKYLSNNDGKDKRQCLEEIADRTGNKKIVFSDFRLENERGEILEDVLTGETLILAFGLRVNDKIIRKIDIGFSLHNIYDDIQSYLYSSFQEKYYSPLNSDFIWVRFKINDFPFSQGKLSVKGRIVVDGNESDWPKEILGFINIQLGDFYQTGRVTENIAPFLIKGLWI